MRLLATTVTSLEMRRRPDERLPPPPTDAPLRIDEVRQMPIERYRALYKAIGAPHHWTSRLLPDARLKREIHAPRTRIFVMTLGSATAGWFELEIKREIDEARIVHFGIMPGFRGRDLAHFMLSQAIWAGFSEGARRLTIETNTLDHPAALPLYKKHGFRPYATRDVKTPAIEAVREPVREVR
ncbi:GNAT family N-acetyltransferase [Jiella sp. M17.18]|uniref:GNAT family N-acetyltransferase n=1 Tax=Jiella sp. M17.18 TaxID=3234247 RepID=UPI0034E02A1F